MEAVVVRHALALEQPQTEEVDGVPPDRVPAVGSLDGLFAGAADAFHSFPSGAISH